MGPGVATERKSELDARSALSDSARVVFFPGLGADARLYQPQRGAIPGLETPGWLEPSRGESLRTYSARWGAALGISESLKRGQRVVLGGVSMGGMVGLEMARACGASAVVLIGSCRGPGATNVLLRAVERAARWTPSVVIDKGRVLAPVFLGRGGGGGSPIPAADRKLLCQMARETRVDFLRWASRAIIEWEGCDDPGVQAWHIHGTKDWVIMPWRVKPDVWVKGGAHVLNMSHPNEVNAFVREIVRGDGPT